MKHQDQGGLREQRQLLADLRALQHTAAPSSLLAHVVAQIGPGDSYAPLATTIGTLFVAYNDVGISAIRQATTADDFERSFRARFERPIRPVGELPPALAQAIQAHLSGDQAIQLHFDLRSLRPFERAVLLKALEIPRGEVRPYAWVAREIGRPKAVRAVGSALGANPIPLLIPCHRVVRSDYRIGDYIFGSAAKRTVLTDEGAAPEVLEALARGGVRYLGDRADGTFCLPSCGGMHLRANQHYLKLRSASEAAAAGLAPCGSCRPTIAT